MPQKSCWSGKPTSESSRTFTNAIPEGKFGGTNAADTSGKLKYVRIQFAGFNFVADREFNNLTLCGVGTGTTIDYVQVHGGTDDGVEFFGGTVNVKHIVSSQNGDDGLDTDNGWQGKGQFIVVQNSLAFDAPQVRNTIDRDRAAQLGVSVSEIGNTLDILVGGGAVAQFDRDSNSYDVITQVPKDWRDVSDS